MVERKEHEELNLVETYVSNIRSVSPPNEYGFRTLIADTNCYGIVERKKNLTVSKENYKSILEKGYYLS